ncbi:ABC transporter permease [Herbiconiux sp.]|uniref:ABC transporter permease n=1 Tax=Herbiconiux sp. TaxID=1871186 RepID=UPI0025BCBE90|nr:ABC transporter permease [Herbiconiux sp.]
MLIGFVDWIMPLACAVLMVYFAFATKAFFTFANISTVITQNAPTFVVAGFAGMLLMSGYVDLSVGSMMALSGVSAAIVFNSAGVGAGVVTGLAVGLLVGVVNGILIGVLGLSPIVVTLGGLAGGRAMAQFLAPDSIFGFPPPVGAFANTSFLGITYVGWVAIIVSLILVFVMGALPIGKRIQAIGVNPRASFLVGIRVKWTVVALYAAVGLAVGIAGLLQVARLDSAPSGTLGLGFEVTILTAILLGGIPFTGGRGSIWRVLIGVWLLAILKNGLTLMNFGPEVAGMVTGGVLVVAAGLEALTVWLRRRA